MNVHLIGMAVRLTEAAHVKIGGEPILNCGDSDRLDLVWVGGGGPAVYCIAVGGAAYLVSKAIRKSRVLAFEDLGMEAIYEFEVKDMPVTVAVDSSGNAVHKTGPAEWRAKIGKIPVVVG